MVGLTSVCMQLHSCVNVIGKILTNCYYYGKYQIHKNASAKFYAIQYNILMYKKIKICTLSFVSVELVFKFPLFYQALIANNIFCACKYTHNLCRNHFMLSMYTDM